MKPFTALTNWLYWRRQTILKKGIVPTSCCIFSSCLWSSPCLNFKFCFFPGWTWGGYNLYASLLSLAELGNYICLLSFQMCASTLDSFKVLLQLMEWSSPDQKSPGFNISINNKGRGSRQVLPSFYVDCWLILIISSVQILWFLFCLKIRENI